MLLKTMPNNLGVYRVGIITSQKVSKKAVVRNKIRRRLSEIAKNFFKSAKNNIDVVIVALPGIETKDFSEIKEMAEKALKKISP